MVILLAGIMAIVAFVVLMRLLWVRRRPSGPTAVIGIAVVVLLTGLAVLAATGRLHWIAALFAAVIPFLRRALGLLRYVPLFRGLFGAYQSYSSTGNRQSGGPGAAGSEMSADQACQVLGLAPNPSREEVIDAHRRLMQKIHPDRGGSTYLAQQLNEAKRVLLKATS